MKLKIGTVMLAAAGLVAGSYADIFGSGANEFELTFENISSGSNPSSGYGQVGYDYGIGTHEVTATQWQKFMNIQGTVGSGSAYDSNPTTAGDQAVDNASWYEAAQFVNWLNTSKGHQAAYSFDGSGNMSLWGAGDQSGTSAFRHKDAVYVLPSEDEWVKAAYWNGTTLQTYATPGDTVPAAALTTGANYNNAIGSVWNVGSGAEDLNGTYDMMGNVWEWNESGYNAPDDSTTENRVILGGALNGGSSQLRSSNRYDDFPTDELDVIGFRVAAIPEPSTIAFVGIFGGGLMLIRRYFPSV